MLSLTHVQHFRSLLAIAGLLPCVADAEVQPSALFTDGMVIQRNTQAPIWGTADPGEQVSVSGSWGATQAAIAGQDGNWIVKLQTPEAGGPHSLTIKGENSIKIGNVLSGEVWFCSGQSNMGWRMEQLADPITKPKPERKHTAKEHLAAAAHIKQEIETAQDTALRYFTVPKTTSPLQASKNLTGSWAVCSPENTGQFYATAYFFARELRRELNVPVGLIQCAWGGTRIEPWMPEEAFAKDPDAAIHFKNERAKIAEAASKWDPVQVEKAYTAAMQQWQKNRKDESGKKKRKPLKAIDPSANKQIPTTLFNSMMYPVIPYAIRGAIWYQGESNTGHRLSHYETSFRLMIESWREHWGQGDFPFYFAQLANFKEPILTPLESDNWASIREQQRRTLALTNTGMAVLTDIGESNDVHPHNKIDVGKRLALWALKHDYNADIPVWSGPLYKSHEIRGNQVIVRFDSVGSGLMSGTKTGLQDCQPSSEPLKHFQICGNDRQWRWAQVEIIGKDAVAVTHPDIQEPQHVRYAWSTNPKSANLYNQAGLPASIFTTEAEIPE
jgi:sialate O-acetylesterase